MKSLVLLLSVLLSIVPAMAIDTGSADQVYVIPHTGGRAKFGQVDLSQSAAVKNQLPLSKGGTNANLTAAAGAMCYSTASAEAFTAVGSAGQVMQSNGTSAPAFSTATYPSTTTINRLLYSSSANVVGQVTTANIGALVPDSGGIPSIAASSANGNILRRISGAISFGTIDLSDAVNAVTNALGMANGGTGLSSAGTAGNVLRSTGSAWVSDPPVSGRNYLINGAFDLWVRGSTSSTIGNGTVGYVADRWYSQNNLGTAGVLTVSQTTGAVDGSTFGMSVKVSTAPSVGISSGINTVQVLENPTAIALYNKTVSAGVSVKALGNITQVTLAIVYATTEAEPTLTNTLGTATCTVNSSTFTSCTVPGVAVSTTPTVSGVIGLYVKASAVASGNISDLNNGYVLEQAILNRGTIAAPFERAGNGIGGEQLLAYRFLSPVTDDWVGAAASTTTCGVQVRARAVMRAAPNFVITGQAKGRMNGGSDGLTGATATQASTSCATYGCYITLGAFTGLTTGNTCNARGNSVQWAYMESEI